MVCYFPGTAFCGLVIGALIWRAWHVICQVTDIILKLGEFAGIALLATMAIAAATLVVGFIEWTARRIRERQAARGACLTCSFPCQEAQVQQAQEREPIGPRRTLPVRVLPHESRRAG